jgi:hypothetical protein
MSRTRQGESEYILNECNHFLDLGESPEQIAAALGREGNSIYKLAHHKGDKRVAAAFLCTRTPDVWDEHKQLQQRAARLRKRQHA